ncbi:MAG: hypothetical protein ACSLFM_09850 [Tepidiformaceae bacterium]
MTAPARRHVFGLVTLLGLATLTALGIPDTTVAVYENGTYLVVSPRSSTAGMTSPGRFHNSCDATPLWDSPDFDNGTCIKAALVDGDFSVDIAGADGDAAWLDIDPEAINGHSSGGAYRVVAGAVGTWNANCPNGGFQTFYLQTKNSSNQWENNAKITIGHIDTFQYAEHVVVLAESTARNNTIIGRVAHTSGGCWPEHLHVQVWNYEAWARVFDWDGPENDEDDVWGSMCVRSGTSSYNCNTESVAPTESGMSVGLILLPPS